MHNVSPIIFLSIILGIYAAINITLVVNLSIALRGYGMLRFVAVALLIALALVFPVGRIVYPRWPEPLASILLKTGVLYIAPMTYAFLLTVLIDLVLVCNKIFVILPRATHNMRVDGAQLCAIVLICAAGISFAGWVNASRAPVVRRISYTLPNAAFAAPMRIVAVSDVHAGRNGTIGHLKKIADVIKSENPQAVLFLGDTVDDFGAEESPKIAEIMRSIDPPLGKWAVLGNHEYYSHLEECKKILADGGIKTLVDDFVVLDGRLLLAGRDDPTAARYGRQRAPLETILARRAAHETALPVLLMDHQPIDLAPAERNNVFLQLSGHTHNGQIFPFNLLIAPLFEAFYGPYARGGTNYWISSGGGTWGPPVRTTGSPELLSITIGN